MKARLFLAVCLSVIVTNIAVAQNAQGVIVNGLVVGEKYSLEQLNMAFGTPKSVVVTEDGISVLSYGKNRVYWYGKDSSTTEKYLLWGADIKDSHFRIDDDITVGVNKKQLANRGVITSSTDDGVIYWQPQSVPESMRDAYNVMVYTDNRNRIQSIVVHISM